MKFENNHAFVNYCETFFGVDPRELPEEDVAFMHAAFKLEGNNNTIMKQLFRG